jgi:prolyl 4-hydroxylase
LSVLSLTESIAWYPGDLNRMFQRIVNDPDLSRKHNVTILSGPSTDDIDGDDGPWVILLENVLNASEADRFIELGAKSGYERSVDSGEILDDGTFDTIVTEDRTSTNAWCSDDCADDPVTIDLFQRMQTLVGIPMSHSEEIQLLRYEQGQFYNEHHDYNEDEYDMIQGVRILTIYIYLNTMTESGGGTMFPALNNLTIYPVLGRVVIWPSVYNSQPHIMDPRTNHQALPVTGENVIKYGANVWIHQRELVDGCL